MRVDGAGLCPVQQTPFPLTHRRAWGTRLRVCCYPFLSMHSFGARFCLSSLPALMACFVWFVLRRSFPHVVMGGPSSSLQVAGVDNG